MDSTNGLMRSSRAALVLAVFAGLFGLAGCGPQGDNGIDPTTLGVFTPGTNGTVVAGTQSTTIIEGLTVTPSALQFGADLNTLSFRIENHTGGDIGFEILGGEDWMHVDPRVAVVANGGHVDVTVTIYRVLILSGDALGSIQIQIPDREPVSIPITVGNAQLPDDTGTGGGGSGGGNGNTNGNDPAAALSVNTDSLNFGGSADALIALVRNSGGGSMSFTAQSTATWLRVENNAGTSTGEYNPIRVVIDRRDLPVGPYSGFVDVDGAGRKHRIAVSMRVDTAISSNPATPQYFMGQTLLDFETGRLRMPAYFRNDGAMVGFRIVRSASWIATSGFGGVTRGRGHLITVSVDRTGLSPGEHWGTVDLVFENGVVKTFIVRAEVPAAEPAPTMIVSPTDVDLGGTGTEASLALRTRPLNSPMSYRAFPTAAWLSVSPDRGEMSETVHSLTLAVDRSQLSPGNHDAHVIIVSSAGGVNEVHVRVLVPSSGDGSVAPPNWGSSDTRLDVISIIEPGTPGYILPQTTGVPQSWWAGTPYVHTVQDSDPGANSPKYYRQTILAMEAANGNCVYGSYISGAECRKTADMYKFPPESIPYESVTPSYFSGPYDEVMKRGSVDLSIEGARKQMADLIVNEALGRGVQAILLDNVSHPGTGGTDATWPQICDYFRDIKTRLNANGMRLTANLACQPYDLAGQDAQLLATAVDGLNFEQTFHWVLVRPSPANIVTEINVYRYWLDQGLHVNLMAAWSDIVYDRTRRLEEERFLAGCCMIIRRPGDTLAVPRAYFEPPPDWVNWPVSFGAPLGDYTISMPGPVLTRDFEHATISVDFAKSMDAAQAANSVTVVWH